MSQDISPFPRRDMMVAEAYANAKFNRAQRAPRATVEALMYALRRGVNELNKPDILPRLSMLDEGQLNALSLSAEFQTGNCNPVVI
jgi:hypothetical protein